MKSATEKIKIGLTEDNRVNRNTFMEKVGQYPELEVVVTAMNGHDFLEQLKQLDNLLLPKVVFMDIQMPEMNGIDTITIAKSIYPEIHFIILTVFEDNELEKNLLTDDGIFVLEHNPHHDFSENPHCFDVRNYGKTIFSFFKN